MERGIDLAPALSLMAKFDGVGDLANRSAATGGSGDRFCEKGASAFAEFTPVALIELGEVPHELSGEPANALGETPHGLGGLPIPITRHGGHPLSNRSNRAFSVLLFFIFIYF